MNDNHRFKKLLGEYSDALAAVEVMNQFANAEDAAALESISLFITDKVMSKYFPSMMNNLNWFKWAKTAMHVFKDFVFDPYLIRNELALYSNRRKALDPEDAIANVRAFGTIRLKMLQKFRKLYGDEVFQEITPSSMRLLPKWKPHFDDFFVGYFERQHQFNILKAKQRALKKTVEVKSNEIADKLALLAEKFAKEGKVSKSDKTKTTIANKNGYVTCPETKYSLVPAYTRKANPFDTQGSANYTPGKIGRTKDILPKFYVECRYGKVGAEIFRILVQWNTRAGQLSNRNKPAICHSRLWNTLDTWRKNYNFSIGTKRILIQIGRRFEGGNKYSNPLNRAERDAAARFLVNQAEPLAFPCKKPIGW